MAELLNVVVQYSGDFWIMKIDNMEIILVCFIWSSQMSKTAIFENGNGERKIDL